MLGSMSTEYATVLVACSLVTAAFAIGTTFWLEAVSPAVSRKLGTLATYWAFLSGLLFVIWVVFYLA
jgi:hypothetical protein